jgi:DNA-binding response OmpR family regulator
MRPARALAGARILIVEDDALILMELASMLADVGAETVIPCRSLEEAEMHADDPDVTVALLDIRLGRNTITPVSRRLAARRIPLVFYTGQFVTDSVRRECPSATWIQKPAPGDEIVRALLTAIGSHG